MSRMTAISLALIVASSMPSMPGLAQGAESQDARPLSPAQIALFETPHLSNLSQPVTLEYSFVENGAADFTDRVAIHVSAPHPDGSKLVSFDFLTGVHKIPYPPVDNFTGNPLLMMFLEHDVAAMKQQLGLSATYFRNRIREAFVDGAVVNETSFVLDGQSLAAKRITVQPFLNDHRLDRLPSVQAKTYVFVLADGVPGTLAELHTELPPDPTDGAPALRDTLTYTGKRL